MKKYTLEVPYLAVPPQQLFCVNHHPLISVVAYGGAPDSPLNGGRNNFTLDRMPLKGRFSFGLTKRQLARANGIFGESVTALNKNGISFRLAFTNMFVSPDELNEKNLRPVKELIATGEAYGITNGVIVNNPLLEQRLRSDFCGKLSYVSSCTKYVSPHAILTPQETLPLYMADCARYDYVCLTPQDSRRVQLLGSIPAGHRHKIIAIVNSYCSDACNSYYHYERTSRENKQSLTLPGGAAWSLLMGNLRFLCRKGRNCSALRQVWSRMRIEEIAAVQLKAGIVNFKLGRGFGDDGIGRVVAAIDAFEKGNGQCSA